MASESCVILDSCRVCMIQRVNTTREFEEIFDTSICVKLQFCTGLQVLVTDSLPTQICAACLEDLHSAYKFKTTCLESDQTYRELLRPKVKKEVEDDSEPETPMQDSLEEEQSIKLEDSKVEDELLDAVLKQSNTVNHSRKRLKSDGSPAQDVKLPPVRTRRKRAKPEGEECPPLASKPAKYRRLFCELCQMKFTTKSQSDEHKKLVHREQGKSWICEQCGAMFAHQSSHISHARCHRPPTFACTQCDYVTWQKHDLKKHVQIHTGFKPYQCEFCTAAYFNSSNLKSHIERVHHKVKRFQCPICRKQFFERHKLDRHVDSHNDIKRFTCQLCDCQFTRGSYWRRHMVKRHGVEPPRARPGRRRTVFSMGLEPAGTVPADGDVEDSAPRQILDSQTVADSGPAEDSESK